MNTMASFLCYVYLRCIDSSGSSLPTDTTLQLITLECGYKSNTTTSEILSQTMPKPALEIDHNFHDKNPYRNFKVKRKISQKEIIMLISHELILQHIRFMYGIQSSIARNSTSVLLTISSKYLTKNSYYRSECIAGPPWTTDILQSYPSS